MTDNLMSLGLFVFKLSTAPIDTFNRHARWRWPSKDRIGTGPAYQYTGPGEDSMTVKGSLARQITGTRANIEKLREMANQGKSWTLVTGLGEDLGPWFIESLSEDHKLLDGNGEARVIEFTINLKSDPDAKSLGNLADSDPENS